LANQNAECIESNKQLITLRNKYKKWN